MAATGIIELEHQCAALGADLSLLREVSGRVILPSGWSPALRGGRHSEGTPGGYWRPSLPWMAGHHQQQEIEAVGCLDNTSILERSLGKGQKGTRGAKGVKDSELLFTPLTVGKLRFGEEQRRSMAAFTLGRHQRP